MAALKEQFCIIFESLDFFFNGNQVTPLSSPTSPHSLSFSLPFLPLSFLPLSSLSPPSLLPLSSLLLLPLSLSLSSPSLCSLFPVIPPQSNTILTMNDCQLRDSQSPEELGLSDNDVIKLERHGVIVLGQPDSGRKSIHGSVALAIPSIDFIQIDAGDQDQELLSKFSRGLEKSNAASGDSEWQTHELITLSIQDEEVRGFLSSWQPMLSLSPTFPLSMHASTRLELEIISCIVAMCAAIPGELTLGALRYRWRKGPRSRFTRGCSSSGCLQP